MLNRSLLLTTVLLVLTSMCYAIPPADNSTSDRIQVKDSLYASMTNVDDIGLVIVWNGHGAETVLNCAWSGGNHGADSGDISKHLTRGNNYIIYVCYNRVYSGGMLFAGGKWSFNFSLAKNESTVWRNSKHVRENDAALKYWKVIKANVDSNGYVDLSDSIDSSVLRQLRSAMGELERKLDRNAGVATPF